MGLNHCSIKILTCLNELPLVGIHKTMNNENCGNIKTRGWSWCVLIICRHPHGTVGTRFAILALTHFSKMCNIKFANAFCHFDIWNVYEKNCNFKPHLMKVGGLNCCQISSNKWGHISAPCSNRIGSRFVSQCDSVNGKGIPGARRQNEKMFWGNDNNAREWLIAWKLSKLKFNATTW